MEVDGVGTLVSHYEKALEMAMMLAGAKLAHDRGRNGGEQLPGRLPRRSSHGVTGGRNTALTTRVTSSDSNHRER
jgi:hypothetical protein